MDQEDALRGLAQHDPDSWGDILFDTCGVSDFLRPSHFSGFLSEDDQLRNSIILERYGDQILDNMEQEMEFMEPEEDYMEEEDLYEYFDEEEQ